MNLVQSGSTRGKQRRLPGIEALQSEGLLIVLSSILKNVHQTFDIACGALALVFFSTGNPSRRAIELRRASTLSCSPFDGGTRIEAFLKQKFAVRPCIQGWDQECRSTGRLPLSLSRPPERVGERDQAHRHTAPMVSPGASAIARPVNKHAASTPETDRQYDGGVHRSGLSDV